MKFRSFSYFIEEAAKNIIRNSLMSVTSVITVSACVFMLVLLYCVVINVDFALKNMEGSIGVIKVIIDKEADNEHVLMLYDEIRALPHVENVSFLSSEDVFEKQKEQLGDILNGLPSDIFRKRFEVEVDSSRYQSIVMSGLERVSEEIGGVYSINQLQEVVDILNTISNIVRIVCAVIIVLLLALAMVIITNTIKLAVNNRKTEISIMKYVGATDWFIRWPFFLEGAFIGVLGSVVPIVSFGMFYDPLVASINGELDALAGLKPAIEIFPVILMISLVFGGLIGVIGSALSIRKYLKV